MLNIVERRPLFLFIDAMQPTNSLSVHLDDVHIASRIAHALFLLQLKRFYCSQLYINQRICNSREYTSGNCSKKWSQRSAGVTVVQTQVKFCSLSLSALIFDA